MKGAATSSAARSTIPEVSTEGTATPPSPSGSPPPPPFRGLEHLGLRVDDLDAAAAALKAKGAVFTLEPKEVRPGVRIAFVQAPDGAQVELLQRG